MMAGDPHYGGATWAVLQYILGLRRLGHHAFFVEPIAADKIRPGGAPLAESSAAAYFRRIGRAHGLDGEAALLVDGTRETVGLSYDDLQEIANRTDLLINVSGMLTDAALLERIPRRLYLDLDPGFNQVWHAGDGIDMRFDAHTHFATVGLAVGQPGCAVPTCDRSWFATCPPVVTAEWTVADEVSREAFTTVANWRSYGSAHYNGVFLGQKAHALRPLIDLPRRSRAAFALALSIHADEPDVAALEHHGWSIVDPIAAAGTPDRYRQFVRGSRAEIGIAKSGYVAMRSGWVSDRSACYLASGRPVLAQDTGFGDLLPSGEGLLTFSTTEDAVAGVEAIDADYDRHRRAARSLAETYFDSDRVLTRLLDYAGGPS
jgi:hypothetical protein